MSLPPDTIQVKRKADSDGPVNFLRVEGTKRRRSGSGSWLYQRKQPDVETPQAIIPPPRQDDIRPVIHTSRPLKDVAPPKPPATGNVGSQSPEKGAGSTPVPSISVTAPAEPRRFHMTRPQRIPLSSGDAPSGGISKKTRYAPTVFVERTSKRKRAGVGAAEHPKPQDAASAPRQESSTPTGSQDGEMADAAPPRFKRPGAIRRAKAEGQDSSDTNKPRPRLPSSLLNRQHDENMEQLARDMDAYALEQIGINLGQQSSQPTSKPASISLEKKHRPKAPAQRYSERHPEDAPPAAEPEDVDMQDSDTEEGDYVIETYVRVHASTMAESVSAQEVGLLVFDNDPDVEFFYGAEGDSEEEQLDDDDADSNAEDYYTADYPDDEVESDDEYGRDPYLYRNGNASDLEEYDEDYDDDAVGSDNGSPRRMDGFASLRSQVFGAQPFRG